MGGFVGGAVGSVVGGVGASVWIGEVVTTGSVELGFSSLVAQAQNRQENARIIANARG